MIKIAKIVFRGKTIEELRQMNLKEFAKLVPSRERRSLLKLDEKHKSFIEGVKAKTEKKKAIKTHLRDMVIIPSFVGLTFGVHNGKEFMNIEIKEKMLGHRLGEFVDTRKRINHSDPGVGATKSSAFSKK